MNLKPQLLFEKKLKQESELKDLIPEIASKLEKDSLVLLSGDLGAGKTTTLRCLCEFYGIQLVQSPTYAIHQRYEKNSHVVDHFDLYRLDSEDELVSTGFWDLLQEKESLVFIEWYEKIGNLDWLETEKKQRKIFGLKIEIRSKERQFKFFQLI